MSSAAQSYGDQGSRNWVLDVVFGEDQSRARTGHADENLAALRRWALNLLRADTLKAKGRREAAAGTTDTSFTFSGCHTNLMREPWARFPSPARPILAPWPPTSHR